ncbi:MAG: hypothetical protein FWE67_16510 [Planctomycetaceae bacterium]|nr:hypothetical protein [Planctomycetaceae bacterium]
MDFTDLTPTERLLAEQAVLLHGREFMRQTVERIAQEKIDEIDSVK